MPRAAIVIALLPLLAISQDFSELNIGKVMVGYRFTNSPVWSREGHWLIADTPSNRIIQLTPGQKPEVSLENAPGASGMAFDGQGRLYVCEARARRVVRIDKKKNVDALAEKWQGKRFNGPARIVVRKDGNVYFTDPAFGYQQDARELDFYGVYRITPKGELDLVAKSATRPDGIALAPAGRTLYVGDSDRRSVRAYDLDRSGAASNERTFINSIDGIPLGMCTDEKGNLYIAARGLEIYSAEGKHLKHIEFKDPSSCGFGDPDLQSMYVTAGPSVYRVRLTVKGAFQY